MRGSAGCWVDYEPPQKHPASTPNKYRTVRGSAGCWVDYAPPQKHPATTHKAPGAWLAQVNIPCTTQYRAIGFLNKLKRLLIVKVERLGKDPVASTTPSGLPAWGPRSAPGSVFVDPRCQALWQGFALIILNVYNRINYVTLSP